jgi:hypothetical protein
MIIVKRIRGHLIRELARLSRGATLVAALAAVLAITTLSPVSASAGTQAHPASTAGNSALDLSAQQAATQLTPGSAGVAITRVRLLAVLPPGVTPAVKLPPCIPKINSFDRTHECWLESITFTFFNGRTPIGTNEVFFFQYIALVSNRANWSEEDEVVATIPVGETAPITARMSASCGADCTARARFKGVLKPRLPGSVSYSTNVGTNAKIETPTRYRLIYGSPGFIPLSVTRWNSPWQYRCDKNVAIGGTGCVVPKFIPTLDISQSTYGAAAAMIAWAQKNLSGHWGLKGKGDPLRRLNNPRVRTPDDNRKVICRRQWRAAAPWSAGSVKMMKDSCDEFPFAATYESGAMPPHPVANGAECAQVEAKQTSDTGDDPAKLWNNIVVIGKFSPRDKCVRGHIPIELNTDVGNKAYLALIRSDRLIDEDPFWVAVSS